MCWSGKVFGYLLFLIKIEIPSLSALLYRTDCRRFLFFLSQIYLILWASTSAKILDGFLLFIIRVKKKGENVLRKKKLPDNYPICLTFSWYIFFLIKISFNFSVFKNTQYSDSNKPRKKYFLVKKKRWTHWLYMTKWKIRL